MGPLKALRAFTTCLAVTAFALTSACALNLPPIRVDASSADRDRLVGRWTGEYKSDDNNGRSGSIVFILGAGQSVARGDVLTSQRGSDARFEGRDPERGASGRTLGSPSRSLAIRFVHAEEGELFGELDPYWDPDLQCEAVTSFEGVLAGDTIRGTYTTTFSNPRIKTTGHWQMTRLHDASAPRR